MNCILKNLRSLYLLLILLNGFSCASKQGASDIQAIAKTYYKVYQERSDFQKFLDFYQEDIVLEDIMLGKKLEGKAAFAEFFDWDNPDFSTLDTFALVIEEQIIENNQVVTKGYFTPFKWGETTFEAMHFTTLLTFGNDGKIQKQIDWINYPNNLIDYSKRENSNDWISNGSRE